MLSNEIPVREPSSAINVLVGAELCASNGEARRLIDGGAVSVNGEKIFADQEILAPSLLKKGKNSFVLVR